MLGLNLCVTEIGGKFYGSSESADLSTLFDVGGIAGVYRTLYASLKVT